MNKTLPAFKYLFKSSIWVLLIGFANVLLNAGITDSVYYFTTKQYASPINFAMTSVTMSFEFTSAMFILIICMAVFPPHFKALLANGVSRRSYFLANVPFIASLAVVYAIWDVLVLLAHEPFMRAILFNELVYSNMSLASELLFQFAMFFCVGILGWLITLSFYRCDRLGRWLLSLAPITLLGVLLVFNINSNGSLLNGFIDGYKVLMGTYNTPHNPFIAVVSLLSLSVLLCGIIFTLLRRAPLRD